MQSLNIGATGMMAQQKNVEVISHNIANLSTTAYHRRRMEFQDLMYQNYRRAGISANQQGDVVPTGIQIGLGVKPVAVYRVTLQGSQINTNNPLDLSVNGGGYFRIALADGNTGYTRAGNFQLSPDRTIVTADGLVVQPGLTMPENTVNISINNEGQVYATVDGEDAPQLVGQFELSIFPNEAGLVALGDNLFIESPASGEPNTGAPGSPAHGLLLQGFLEASNVNSVEEITNLIRAQRSYEMNSKSIETSDQMMATVSQLR